MIQTRAKWGSLVLSRDDFWMIWNCHGIPCFYIYFFFNNGKREQVDENECAALSESVIPKVLDHSHVRSFYGGPRQRCLKDTLQLRILWICINIGVKPAPRHLTYYCMLLFLPNKSSFEIWHRCRACSKTFDLLLYASLSSKQT